MHPHMKLFPARAGSAVFMLRGANRPHVMTFRPSEAECALGATAKCLHCGQVFLDADDTRHPCPGPRS